MTSGHDDRVIDVEPKNVQEETFEHLYEDFTPGERPPLLRYKYSEPWMKPWAKRAIRVSPLLGITVNDGLYLRSSLGDGWLAFPLAGLVFSIFALITNHAAATPPALWLVLTLTAIGIFDVSAGALAWVVYVAGSILTGHLFVSSWIGTTGHPGFLYIITSYFYLAVLWFIGPALPRKLRRDPLQDPEKFFDKLYMWGGDVFVSGLAMLVVLGAFPSLAPTLTGAARFGLTTVTLQNHATIFKIVIVAAIVVRALFERFVIQAFELFHPWDKYWSLRWRISVFGKSSEVSGSPGPSGLPIYSRSTAWRLSSATCHRRPTNTVGRAISSRFFSPRCMPRSPSAT